MNEKLVTTEYHIQIIELCDPKNGQMLYRIKHSTQDVVPSWGLWEVQEDSNEHIANFHAQYAAEDYANELFQQQVKDEEIPPGDVIDSPYGNEGIDDV